MIEKIKIKTELGTEEVKFLEEEKRSYEMECNLIKYTILEKSIDINLEKILLKINENKEYIFDFIYTEEIQKVIKNIKNRYRFNKDEAEDTAMFVITEFFYMPNELYNLNKYNESVFLDRFEREIAKRTHTLMRSGYSAKEIPASDQSIYTCQSYDDFEDTMIQKIDLQNALNKLSIKNKEMLELNVHDGLTESEIGKKYNLSREGVNKTIIRSKNKIKKYL